MTTLQESLNSIITLIKISSFTEPVLYYSNASITFQDNGTTVAAIPLIVEHLKFETVSILPFTSDSVINEQKPIGFKLGYTTEVLYEIPKYYGAIVEIFIGTSTVTDISQLYALYRGHISNVTVDGSSVGVTVSNSALYLDQDLLETYNFVFHFGFSLSDMSLDTGIEQIIFQRRLNK